MAHDPQLDREVALKVAKASSLSTQKRVERFLREAKASAQLRHPNIVPVFDAGKDGERYYIAAAFIKGQTLEAALEKECFDGRRTAQVVRALAEALAYAHGEGIVHRDVKPANVMLDEKGQPLLMDFGLAARQEEAEKLTQEGAILGTPLYMAPEQARGQTGYPLPASDQYSLGIMLYEMLAGDTPFHGPPELVLANHLTVEPKPPGKVNPEVPRDLETICLKCLEKDADRRYASCQELADDLRRWLEGEPVAARRLGFLERGWRWCRRNPLVAGLSVALGLLLLAVTAGALATSVWFSKLAGEADKARRGEAAKHLQAVELRKEAEGKAREALLARRDGELILSDLHVSHGLTAAERGDAARAVLWFAKAAEIARADTSRQEINQVRVRTWGRRIATPTAAVEHPGGAVRFMAFHPEGRHLAALDANGRCILWDLTTEKALTWPPADKRVSSFAWALDGKSFTLGTEAGSLETRAFPTGTLLSSAAVTGPIRALVYSPDGSKLAVASDGVRIWDVPKGEFATDDFSHPRTVLALTFHPEGKFLATACADGMARVFALGQGAAKPLFPPVAHLPYPGFSPTPVAPLFIDEGRGLLTVAGIATAGWHDSTSGKALRQLSFLSPGSQPSIHCIAASPTGKHIVLAGFSRAQMWDTSMAQAAGPFLAHRNFVTSVSFSSDGSHLLTTSNDRTGQLWDVPGGQLSAAHLLHQNSASLGVWSPRGSAFATAKPDGLIRVWVPPHGTPTNIRLPLDGSPSFAQLGLGGKMVLATGTGWWGTTLRTARVYNITTGQAIATLSGEGTVADAALAPGGSTVAVLRSFATSPAERNATAPNPDRTIGQLEVLDRETTKPLFPPVPMPTEPRGVSFSPDGKKVVVVCAGGQIVVLDATRGEALYRAQHGSPRTAENTYPSGALCS